MYAWKLTKDNICNSHRGITGPSRISDKMQTALDFEDPLPGYTRVDWRLYDDDGTLYFEGFLFTKDPGSEDLFAPLDDYGEAFGCTEVRVLNNKTKRWEVV